MPAPVKAENWIDAPQTPGDWSWREEGADSIASFTSPDGGLLFKIACTSGRRIVLSRVGGGTGNDGQGLMTIRTETTARTLASTMSGVFARVELARHDRLLDAMALSRGRFAVESTGVATLYLPSWAEVTRVVEDCR